MGISAGITAGAEALGGVTSALGGAAGISKGLGALGAGATALSSMGGASGQDNPWQEQAVTQMAGQEAQQGQQLMSYLFTGNLPPGMESKFKMQQAGKEAAVKSDYAARGQMGSTAERQDMGNISDQIMAARSDIAMKLFEAGQQENQHAMSVYGDLLKREDAYNQDNVSAFGDFFTALSSSLK